MTLPRPALRRDKVEVDGEHVEVRSLSALEVTKLAGMSVEDAQIWVVACGADLDVGEARGWLESVGPEVAAPVVDLICELSGLGEGANKSS